MGTMRNGLSQESLVPRRCYRNKRRSKMSGQANRMQVRKESVEGMKNP